MMDAGTCNPFGELFVVIVLDAMVGEMGPVFQSWLPHPIVLIGRATETLERLWNGPGRSDGQRRLLGVALLFCIGGGSFLAGLGVQRLAALHWIGWGVGIVVAVTLVAQRSLYEHVKAVAQGLERCGLEEGRSAVGMIVGRDVSSLDESGVCRAAIESCAENYSDGVVAPLFWLALGGLPALCLYKAVNTLDSMVGHRTKRYRFFGWASARCDDLLNFAPARMTGLLIGFVALFWPGLRGKDAFLVMFRDAGTHRSPNAGWPEAAMAGALGMRLGGPRRYSGESVDAPWIGKGGRAAATVQDIRKSLLIVLLCGVCLAGIAAAAAMWRWAS